MRSPGTASVRVGPRFGQENEEHRFWRYVDRGQRGQEGDTLREDRQCRPCDHQGNGKRNREASRREINQCCYDQETRDEPHHGDHGARVARGGDLTRRLSCPL